MGVEEGACAAGSNLYRTMGNHSGVVHWRGVAFYYAGNHDLAIKPFQARRAARGLAVNAMRLPTVAVLGTCCCDSAFDCGCVWLLCFRLWLCLATLPSIVAV